jgi:hypothetical protein
MHERLPLPARVAADASGLTAQATSLLDDEAARAALAAEARAALSRYGIEALADQLNRLVCEVSSAPAVASTAP